MTADTNPFLSAEQIVSSLAESVGTPLSAEQTNALRCLVDRLPGATTLAEFLHSIEPNADLLTERERAIQLLAPMFDCAKKRTSQGK